MPDWLKISRNQAEERFKALPFPTGKEENFRFTPIDYRESLSSEVPTGAPPVPSEMGALGSEDLALLVFEGEEASLHGKVEPAVFSDLLRAATMGSQPAQAQLRGSELFRDDKFAQLTAARWSNGAFLHIPAGIQFEKPLRFVTCARGLEEQYRHLIVVEEGAQAILVQEGWSDDAARFVGELVDLRMGKNSKLHWVVLQQYGAETNLLTRQRLELAEGAELIFTPLYLGAKLAQLRQETHLAGEGALLQTMGAARGDSQQHFDFWLDVRHEASKTRSNLDYWFVMAAKAKGIFNSQVEVCREALDCEASQRSRSLLLGTGTVHSIPKLIIKTDAVKASHGASVSSVNFEQLHYLQSRGIPRAEAERMIVRGFTELVVDKLPTDALKQRADALLDQKAGGFHA